MIIRPLEKANIRQFMIHNIYKHIDYVSELVEGRRYLIRLKPLYQDKEVSIELNLFYADENDYTVKKWFEFGNTSILLENYYSVKVEVKNKDGKFINTIHLDPTKDMKPNQFGVTTEYVDFTEIKPISEENINDLIQRIAWEYRTDFYRLTAKDYVDYCNDFSLEPKDTKSFDKFKTDYEDGLIRRCEECGAWISEDDYYDNYSQVICEGCYYLMR